MKFSHRLVAGFSERAAANIALAVLLSAWVFGGASRFDVLAPIATVTVALAALALFWATRRDADLSLLEKICWGGLFLIPLLQLIPLPPAIWHNLPSHDYPRELFALLGIDGWLSWSLTPSRTLSSLFGFVPALAVYLWAKGLPDRHELRLMIAFGAFAVFSSLLGLIQMAGGSGTPLRFYEITNRDSAVGLFSNANHYGMIMAIAIPVIAYVTLRFASDRRTVYRTRIGLGIVAGAIVSLGAIASTSRAAYIVVLGAWLLVGGYLLATSPFPRRRKLAIGGGAMAIMLAGLVFLGANGTLARIAESDRVGERTRLSFIPEFVEIAGDQAPLGSGIGSFDPVYRVYEDPETLATTYLNNAHNDLAQVAIEAGLPGLVLIALWLWLIARIFLGGYSAATSGGLLSIASFRLAVLGFGTFALLAHSLADYPLRTASASAVLALLLAFATTGVHMRSERR